MPTRPFPSESSLAQFEEQGKELQRQQRAGSLQALQRIREFHPRFLGASDDTIQQASLQQSDLLLAIAREYGFPSWSRLKAFVEHPQPDDVGLPHHVRIHDAPFRQAVELFDSGDVEGLRKHLLAHRDVAHRRVTFEGGNYFDNPALLEFVAENPTRNGRLPGSAVDAARVILDAGATDDRQALNSTVALVASSSVARESGVQLPLIDLLVEHGADPNAGTYVASLYAEFDAVRHLVQRGAKRDLLVATALNMPAEAAAALSEADADTRQRALAMAAQHGYTELVALLLEGGADPNRFAPVGGHSHATPLHQAALGGHEEVVRLLVERGAAPTSGTSITTAQRSIGRNTPSSQLWRNFYSALNR